jgi:DNA-binding FadR family transcriptional regulator
MDAAFDAPRGLVVLDALAAMIDRAGLKVGDKLPPEVALAQRLGVGRSTVREALKRWEGLGLIRRRRGDGTYLAARVQTSAGAVPVMVQLEGQALLRLLEVRRTLETGAVAKAAREATLAQRAAIEGLCRTLLDAVAAGRSWREADWAFHAAVHDASGNPLYGQILRRLDEMLDRSAGSPFERAAFGLGSFPFHADLAAALRAGDAPGAVVAAHAIIDSVEREVRGLIGLPAEGRDG